MLLVSTLLGTSILIGWAKFDGKRQKEEIIGLQYKKMFGVFAEEQYICKEIPLSVPKRQRNKGEDPVTYNKKIAFHDYFDIG